MRSAAHCWSARNMPVPRSQMLNSFIRCFFPVIVEVYDISIIKPLLDISKKHYPG